MTSTTEDNFFKALEMIEPPKQQEIFFRLYYKDDGEIICYSMEELEHDYIELTVEEFAMADPNVYIKNGTVHKKKMISIGKVAPSEDGTPVRAGDFSIVDPTSTFYMANKTYE